MKKLLIVANWKSNMSIQEVSSWIEQSAKGIEQSEEKEVVVCPSFIFLPIIKSYLLNHKSNIKIGAQNVSPFPKGAYTGEISAEQLAEFAKYVIIGHSERRRYFHENDQMLANKVDMSLEAGLKPIFCVQNANTVIPQGVKIIAYEPVFAIGTGEPDSPENANDVAREIKEAAKAVTVLYGGSVTEKNVHTFTKTEHIDGVLVGSASLDPTSFSHIVTNA